MDWKAGRQAGLNVKCWHYKHKYQLQFSYSQPQDYNLILTRERSKVGTRSWVMNGGESWGRDLQLKNNLSQNLITKRRTRRSKARRVRLQLLGQFVFLCRVPSHTLHSLLHSSSPPNNYSYTNRQRQAEKPEITAQEAAWKWNVCPASCGRRRRIVLPTDLRL